MIAAVLLALMGVSRPIYHFIISNDTTLYTVCTNSVIMLLCYMYCILFTGLIKERCLSVFCIITLLLPILFI